MPKGSIEGERIGVRDEPHKLFGATVVIVHPSAFPDERSPERMTSREPHSVQ